MALGRSFRRPFATLKSGPKAFCEGNKAEIGNPTLKSRPASQFRYLWAKWSFLGCVWNVFMVHGRSREIEQKTHFNTFCALWSSRGPRGRRMDRGRSFRRPFATVESSGRYFTKETMLRLPSDAPKSPRKHFWILLDEMEGR